MLLETISKRYSAKVYEDRAVEDEKVSYVLDCAMKAPSKQSVYAYEIFVLGNSDKAKDIKEWLFWEESWCVNGKLSTLLKTDESENPQKKMNGQYNAPVLLVWVTRDPDEQHITSSRHGRNVVHKSYSEKKTIDITVSASFAMLAAEEQGLNTCFAKCHNEYNLAERLGRPGQRAELGVGFGYAVPHNKGSEITGKQDFPIYKDGKQFGATCKNLDTSFPTEWHYSRKFRPDLNKLVVNV